MNTPLPELLEGRAYRVRPNKHANHVVRIGDAAEIEGLGARAHRVRCECGARWIVEDMDLFVALSEDEIEDAPRKALHKRDS